MAGRLSLSVNLAPDWGLPGQYLSILPVGSYPAVAPSPVLFSHRQSAFLWHYPHGRPHRTLSGNLPQGARTFLTNLSARLYGCSFEKDIANLMYWQTKLSFITFNLKNVCLLQSISTYAVF